MAGLLFSLPRKVVYQRNVSTTAFLASEVNVASSHGTQVTAMKQRLVTYVHVHCMPLHTQYHFRSHLLCRDGLQSCSQVGKKVGDTYSADDAPLLYSRGS